MRILLLAVLLGWALPGIAQNATVAEGTHVNLRAGKTDNYRVIRVLSPGTQLEILEADNHYARVKTKEGDIGWLPTRLLVIEPLDMQPPAQTAAAESAAAGSPAPTPAQDSPEEAAEHAAIPWRLLIVGALCFLVGAAVGIGVHEAYYRKRLNGLRI